MKNLFEYIQEANKEYKWRVKFAVPVDGEMLDKAERLLAKFDVKKVSPIKKTILQGRPLDFVDAGPSEIYITDVVCGLPCNREAIRELLSNGLNVHVSKIVVRSEHEPLETDREVGEPVDKDKPLLGSDYDKTPDPALVYGDKYNQKLVQDNLGRFKFEVAGKESTTKDKGPVYGADTSHSPFANKTSTLKKHPTKV